MPRRFRFAPTPSRPLHVGSALAAMLGWAAARAADGAFILRIEDIDRARCRPEHEATVLADLAWLGLDWDEGPDVGGAAGPYRQSERTAHYDAALATLAAAGAVYGCRCSRADIRAAQSAPHLHGPNAERPYPGTCRPVDGAPQISLQALALAADRGGVRLDVDRLGEDAVVHWVDGWRGPSDEDVRTTGDVLLGRPGTPGYQLAVVVDDIAMGITDIVRGRDLSGSTARQMLLYRALGADPPHFAHHPLLLDDAGRKLSKRDGDATIASWREAGAVPHTLVAQLGRAVGLFDSHVATATPRDVANALVDASDRLADGVWPQP